MNTSAEGLALIRQSEGLNTNTYLDVAGLATIGYGHRVLPGESFPNGIDATEADALLNQDVTIAELSVARLVTVPLTQGQFDALVDFVFNLGSGRLAASTLLRDLDAGSYDAAALQLLQWDHCGTKEVAGLKIRRAAEYQLWTGNAAPGVGQA